MQRRALHTTTPVDGHLYVIGTPPTQAQWRLLKRSWVILGDVRAVLVISLDQCLGCLGCILSGVEAVLILY